MTTVTLNQNVAECLRSTNQVGGSIVHNICTGTQSFVPWGSLDWLLMIGGGLMCIALIAMMASLAIMVFGDMR